MGGGIKRLGIIAGGGSVPVILAEHCATEGRPVFIAGVMGAAPPDIARFPHQWIALGAVSALFRALRRHGCEEIVFTGAVKRPSLRHLKLDFAGWCFLPRYLLAARGGDDRLLRMLITWFERRGFKVRGVHELLANLCGPPGALGKVKDGAEHQPDIKLGISAARNIGARDIGQAAVACGGVVLAQESADGTDAMLSRCAEIRKKLGPSGRAGVLVKLLKPGQEMRIDLPALGVNTVRLAAEAGLAGIAYEAGATLLIDAPAMIREADAAGLFLTGFSAPQLNI